MPKKLPKSCKSTSYRKRKAALGINKKAIFLLTKVLETKTFSNFVQKHPLRSLKKKTSCGKSVLK